MNGFPFTHSINYSELLTFLFQNAQAFRLQVSQNLVDLAGIIPEAHKSIHADFRHRRGGVTVIELSDEISALDQCNAFLGNRRDLGKIHVCTGGQAPQLG